MANSVLIVTIESAWVRARLLGSSSGSPQEESRVFEAPMASVKGSLKESMAALLEEMESEGFTIKDFDRVLLGLPSHLASLRVLTLPFTDAAKAEEVLPFALGDSLLEDPDDLVFGALPLEGGRTLAVTIERKVIESILKKFEELQISPDWIGLPLLYKDRLLKELHKDISVAALVDTTSITVVKDSRPVHFCYISDPTDLKFALAALQDEGTKVEHFYFTDKAAAWIEELGALITERVHTTEYSDEDVDLSALAMLAADGPRGAGGVGGAGWVGKGTVNFRKGEFVDRKVFESARRSFRVATILICLVALLWGANIYTRLQSPAKEISRIDGALFSAFGELFPNDVAVDPLYQMEVKLKGLSDESKFIEGGLDVLESLKGLSRGIPDAGNQADSGEVRLFELKMHEERVVARGETASFDHADRFKDTLEASGEYKDISLTDVKKKSTGGVSFSVALTLKGEG